MADSEAAGQLREYLLALKPSARALLAAELERATLRGDAPPGASVILQQLRKTARLEGEKLPRIGNAQRLFFAPAEPFLMDSVPQRKFMGRLARASLASIWNWICRDLMPAEARTFTTEVQGLLAANDTGAAAALARAFQDLAEQRLRKTLSAARNDEKSFRRIARQVDTPHAIDDLGELAAILRARDALGAIAVRLPAFISNLGSDQLANVSALLVSPEGRDRDVFLHALLIARNRLGSPWQLIRLAVQAAGSDAATRIAATPFAAAVEIALDDLELMIAALGDSLKRGRPDVADLLKNIHDSARALRTEIDLPGDSAWGRQLAAARAETGRLLQAEIDALPGQVRRLLRPRDARDSSGVLDAGDVADVEAKLTLATACRNYAGELAISEATQRVHADLQHYFDGGTHALLDRLRAAPAAERALRQSQVDAAIRFCARLFGPEYAGLLAKAADIAARGEQKAARS